MNTQTMILPRPALAVVLSPLLLTETCSPCLPDPGDLTPEMQKRRITHITVVLRDILEQKGYHHGGIND